LLDLSFKDLDTSQCIVVEEFRITVMGH